MRLLRPALLLPLLALSRPALAYDLGAVRVDAGLGACTFGGFSMRLGVAPELWWKRVGAGVRLAFDGDLEPGFLSGQHDFVRLEPYALYTLVGGLVAGGGVGAAMMMASPGFSLGGERTWRPVGTASLLVGYLPAQRRLGGLIRVDGNTGGSAAVSAEITFGPSWKGHRGA